VRVAFEAHVFGEIFRLHQFADVMKIRTDTAERRVCADRFGSTYLACSPAQKKQVLDLIAYRKNADNDASLSQGVEFFSFLRNLTADGFFTSELGIKYLGYVGNTHLKEFTGCPPVPET